MKPISVAGFTNLGYLVHSRGQQPVETDMSSKTIVITGGSGGLGLATASALAGLDARVVIVGRNRNKLTAVRDSIEGDVAVHTADLSLLREVRQLAETISDEEDDLDILINNVGVLLPSRSETDEGLETTFATNLAGQFLLTNLLAPKLVESGPARVINVSSGGMYSERIRPDDLSFERGEYRGASAYARTKRGQVILTEMWARRFDRSEVVVHAMHPGWAKTAGVRTSLPTFNKIMGPLLRTPEQGADTIVWLAAAPEPAMSTGGFWFDRRPAPVHLFEATRETEQERAELWGGLVRITGSDLAAGARST